MAIDSFPFIVGWELTMACNIRCLHCASSSGTPRNCELSLQEALAICDMFPDLLVKEVDFTGGESLIRSDWHVIANHLKQMKITTRIISNGLLLTNDTITIMKDAGIASVGVSIDGLALTHDYIRGKQGCFKKAIEGIKRVLQTGMDVTVITSVTAINLEELPLLFKLLKDVGVPFWQIQPIVPLGRCQLATELHLSDEDYLRLGEFFHKTRPLAKKVGMELVPADSLGYYTDSDIFDPPWQGCSAGLISCGITSDGKVKGCLSLPDKLIEGDLRQRDLWDIWFDKNSFIYNRKFDRSYAGNYCYNCSKVIRCKGGCTAMSYGSTGKIHNDPYCFLGIQERTKKIESKYMNHATQ